MPKYSCFTIVPVYIHARKLIDANSTKEASSKSHNEWSNSFPKRPDGWGMDDVDSGEMGKVYEEDIVCKEL